MKTAHILLPCYLSVKLSHSEQKNSIKFGMVETPLALGFASSKHCMRKISLYCTKLRVIYCKILAHQ